MLRLKREVNSGALSVAFVAVAGAGLLFLLRPGVPETGEVSSQELALGKAIYAEHCASCHGAELQGEPDWRFTHQDGRAKAPPHDASGHTWHHSDAYIIAYTQLGSESGVRDDRYKTVGGMPAFKDILSETEIRATLEYIKTSWPDDIRASQAWMNR